MLDPLTAFGVAVNVVQFVDFGLKLVSTSSKLYKNGISIEHKELREQANRLLEFSAILKGRVVSFRHADQLAERARLEGSSQKQVEPPDEIEPLLRSALDHCTNCAEELLDAINKLTVSGRHRKWQSIRVALSSLLDESSLEGKKKKLFQAQQNVQLFLLLYTSANSTSTVLNSQEVLAKTLLQAVEATTQKFEERVRQLKTAFEKAEKHTIVKTENAEQRDYSIGLVEEFVRKSRDENSSLFNNMDENIVDVFPVFARKRLLRTLDFSQIENRYDRIDRAHKQTLEWILRPNEQPGDAKDSFATWLATEPQSSNVYWVTGVPGSGKSTLMRFLSDAPQVKETLRRNQENLPVIVLRCFFWHPGTELQKSMEGLLRTLTLQAISTGGVDYTTLQVSCPLQWQSCLYDRVPTTDWSINDLKALFDGIMGPLSQSNNVIVFVDGLDEYGADRKEREELVDYLLEVEAHSMVKMCLSSRPWNEFKDRLGSCPHIKLEDINKRDMEIFVKTKLAVNPAFRELAMVANDQVSELFEQLVVKSSGVFLWLRLVTRRLKHSAEEGKPLRKLKEILDEIPPDLDEFFKHMLERIDPHERVQASKIFQIVVDPRATDMPDLMMLSFTDELDPNFALSAAMKAETAPEILSRTVALRRRIDSHCMDLLICPPQRLLRNFRPDHWDFIQVEYLHRTVRDFLISKTSLEMLLNYTSGPLDVSWYRCNATLAQMLFLHKFVAPSLPSRSNQCGAQAAQFSTCMRYLSSSDNLGDPTTRSVFEAAVDSLEPFLVDFKDRALHELFRTEFKNMHALYMNAYIEKGPFVSDNASLSICDAYIRHRVSGTHRYLLVAVLADMRELSRHYLTKIRDSEEIWHIFQCAITDGPKTSGVDMELITLLSGHGSSFKDIPSASEILDFYHNWVAKNTHNEESVAKVTRVLLGKLDGLVGTKSELRDFRNFLESKILNTYNRLMAENLLQLVQRVSKTWKTIPQSSGQRPIRTTATVQLPPHQPTAAVQLPPHQPTAGCMAAAQAGARPGATKSKGSVWEKVFGFKS